MKHLFKNAFIKIVSTMLATSILLSIIISNVSADSKLYSSNKIITNELIQTNLNNNSKYSDNEVIVLLADTEQTRQLQLYSIYSEDNESINEEAYRCQTTAGSKMTKVAESTEYIESTLNLGIDFSEMRLLNQSTGKTRNSTYEFEETHNNIFSITLDGTTIEDAIDILSDNPAIAIVEPNYYYEYEDSPNDTNYSQQYALTNILAETAWNTTKGSSTVTVGIIDSGIDGNHEDLINNIWTNPYINENTGLCSICGKDDIHGYNFTGVGHSTGMPGGGTPTDTNGHGTHIAGIVGAEGNNSKGICGVNWDVSLVWLGCCYVSNDAVSMSAAIEALNYAENHNIMIVNNSYGAYTFSAIFERAISNYSGLFIASAGNESQDNDINPNYPSSYGCPNIISVAATDENNDLSQFKNSTSNYGKTTVHVAAPGSNIYSTIPGSEYGYKSGTSMACPAVTGIAALISAKNPNFNAQQIKAIICGSTQNMGKTYNIINDGGIVSAYSAISKSASALRSVTFNYNYISAPTPFVDYVFWAEYINPPRLNPKRDGYLFEGWYTTANCSTLFDFENTKITTNTTVYAKWSPVIEGSFAQFIPDYRFRDVILELLNDTDNGNRTSNSMVTNSDLALMQSIRILDLSALGIRDTTGLELFSGLEELNISQNKVLSIDLSNMRNIKVVDCSCNLLLSMNVTNNRSIKELYCSDNEISYISGLANLSLLEIFECDGNNLSSLSISSLRLLEELNCSENNLSSLTTGVGVKELVCDNNILTHLNVKQSQSISKLDCHMNNLRVLDLSGLECIEYIDVRYNELCEKSDVINYNKWDYPDILWISKFSPQKGWVNEPFTDINQDDYYYKAVQYVYEKGIMTANSSTMFGVNSMLTRGELARILYRMAGKPSVSGLNNPFVNENMSGELLNAVKWLYNNGNNSIMNGTSSTAFTPNGTVTREMLAVVMDRYATRTNITFEQLRDYQTFADDSSISSWAKDSVINMYSAGIINGGDNNMFAPTSTIPKKDVAVILRRFEVIRLYL